MRVPAASLPAGCPCIPPTQLRSWSVWAPGLRSSSERAPAQRSLWIWRFAAPTLSERSSPTSFRGSSTRHLPSGSQVKALIKIGSLALRGRQTDAAEALLWNAYSYRDGRSAWDAFPEEWRQIARDNAGAALADFVNSIGTYPSRYDLATVEAPVVCSYGERSPTSMFRLTRLLAAAIPTARAHRIDAAGHAAPFDATSNFVRLIADTITITSRHRDFAVPTRA